MGAFKIPTIHMNGTNKQTLLDDYQTAREALSNAKEKLMVAAPNGRDYYPQGDGAYEVARLEHGQRLARIEQVITELDIVVEGIADQ